MLKYIKSSHTIIAKNNADKFTKTIWSAKGFLHLFY